MADIIIHVFLQVVPKKKQRGEFTELTNSDTLGAMEETRLRASTKGGNKMNNNKTYQLVLTGLFAAIIVLMTVTPLGYIPMGIINATIIHIRVILGALFCGPKKGAFLGFMCGLTSCIKNTLMPNPSSCVFSPVLAMEMAGFVGVLKSLLICFVPRILVGVLPYCVYLLVKKILGTEK